MQTDATSSPVTQCQICDGGDLKPVLFLGYIPPVNTMPELSDFSYPARLISSHTR